MGPAETLYTSDFYRDMYNALRPGGVVCTQGECQFLHLDLIRKVMGDAQELYPVVDYAYSTVPTYPDGQIGYILAHKAAVAGAKVEKTYLRNAKRPVPEEMKAKLRWYSEEVHAASFVLPAFAQKKLGEIRAPQTVSSGAGKADAVSVGIAAVAGAVLGAGIVSLLLARK